MKGIGLLLCLSVVCAGSLAQTPVVKTTAGYVRGVLENGIPVFKGIPYAGPPVRFMPPAPHTPWTDTLQTSAFGHSAIQPTGGKASGDENCLFLNVYTPATDTRRRAVVVWVHGGSMTNGSGRGMNGHAFADSDDIVTVTINYRLGAFGFLYLGDMDKKYAQSGNLGLLDVVAALKWIRDNIKAFGGDPGRVTLMGESAGAKLISAVMVSPASKGLYQQAILESGSPQCIRDTVTARNERTRLLQQLGLSDPHALLTLAADTIIRAQGRMCDGIGGNSQFGPVYDGLTIMGDAYHTRVPGVRVLIGTNEDEGAAFIGPKADFIPSFGQLFEDDAPYAIAYYRHLLQTDTPYAAAVKTLTQYMYQMHAYRFARSLSDSGAPVWMYRYRYRAGRPFGARHGNELHYIWDAPSKTDAVQRELALEMHATWVRFIKTGDPQTGALPRWPRYSAAVPRVMSFDTHSAVIPLKSVYNDPGFPSPVFVLH